MGSAPVMGNSNFSEFESVGYEIEVGISPFQMLPTFGMDEITGEVVLTTSPAAFAADTRIELKIATSATLILIRFIPVIYLVEPTFLRG
jgi:hypothetical protein